MKIEVQREALLPALISVAAVVERRQTLPILSNLLVETTDEGFVLTSTDLELQISSIVEGAVGESGTITLPAKKFADVCKALPEKGRIKLEVGQGRGLIRCGRSRFALSTLPADDYPSLEGDKSDEAFEVESDLLLRMVERTGFAMAHQDVRYYLNGLLLEVSPGALVAVATDGHRLAKAEAALSELRAWENQRQIIVPAKAVAELKRLLSGSAGQRAKLEIGERTLVVRVGGNVLTTKLIDGRYPDYSRVIPTELERVAVVAREELREALGRTAVLSYEKQKGVRMTFEEGSLKLEVSNPEHEEAEEDIGIEYQGVKTVIGFNVGYWLDVLNTLEGESVEVRFRDSEVSAILTDPQSPGELYVVMPMRI